MLTAACNIRGSCRRTAEEMAWCIGTIFRAPDHFGFNIVNRELSVDFCVKMFPKLKSFEAFVFHEAIYAVIPVFIESNKQLFEFRYFFFWNDQHTAAL